MEIEASEKTAKVAILAGANQIIAGWDRLNQALRSAPKTDFTMAMKSMVGEIAGALCDRLNMINAAAKEMNVRVENPEN